MNDFKYYSQSIIQNKLTLCPLEEFNYSSNYLKWLNDEDVNMYLETRHSSWNEEKVKAFIKSQYEAKDSILFGIFIDKSTHIGNIKIGPINFIHGYAEISYFIGERSYRGKGYASQALNMLITFGKEIGLHSLIAGVYSTNQSGVKILKRNGFKEVGRFKEKFIDSRLNTRVDHILLSFLLKEGGSKSP